MTIFDEFMDLTQQRVGESHEEYVTRVCLIRDQLAARLELKSRIEHNAGPSKPADVFRGAVEADTRLGVELARRVPSPGERTYPTCHRLRDAA